MQCRSKQSKLSALKKTYIGRTLVDKSNHVRQHALNFRQNVYSVKQLEINLLMIPCCYIYIFTLSKTYDRINIMYKPMDPKDYHYLDYYLKECRI